MAKRASSIFWFYLVIAFAIALFIGLEILKAWIYKKPIIFSENCAGSFFRVTG